MGKVGDGLVLGVVKLGELGLGLVVEGVKMA